MWVFTVRFLLWFKGLNRPVPCPYSVSHAPVWEPPKGFPFSSIMVNVTKIMSRIWEGTTIRLRLTAKTGTVHPNQRTHFKTSIMNSKISTHSLARFHVFAAILNEDSVLLGYVAASPDSRFPTFRNSENRISSVTVSYTRRTESSYGHLFVNWRFLRIPNTPLR